MNTNKKLITAIKWIDCMQRGDSPIESLKRRSINEVIVYGATELGNLFVNEAIMKEFRVLAIADKKVIQGGYSYQGIPLISVQQLETDPYLSACVVITSVSFEEEISKELKMTGIENVVSLRELLEC